MYCTQCFMRWQQPVKFITKEGETIPLCPKCNKPMYDTNYSQHCEKKDIEDGKPVYAVDAAGEIYDTSNGSYPFRKKQQQLFVAEKKSLEDWQRKNEEEEAKQDARIDEYFKSLNL